MPTTCKHCGKATLLPCIEQPRFEECRQFFPHSEPLPLPSQLDNELALQQAQTHSSAPLLAEREQTHGHFATNAVVSQSLKRIFRVTEGYPYLRSSQQEALDAMAMKISRILSGRADEPDHWRDIAGYATLIVEELEKDKP